MSYQIKETPEDFLVEEILDTEKLHAGRHFIYTLWKKDLTTQRAIELIGERYGIPTKDIGFCGNKDKKAVTTQHISLPCRVPLFKTEKLGIGIVAENKQKLTLGSHQNNKFTITVKGLTNDEYANKTIFANYFGEQRFSKNNAEIGEAILKKEYARTCSLIDEPGVKLSLDKNPKDYVSALRRSNVRFFIHAFQSKIFNEVLGAHLEEFDKKSRIPLPNFDLEANDKRDRIVLETMREYDIKPEAFITRDFPECIAEKT